MNYKLPSEKAKEKLNIDKESEKTLERLREVVNKVFETEEGRELFSWLRLQCGFESPSLAFNSSGEVSTHAVVYNEGRRNLYLQLRELVHKDLLSDLETKDNYY